METVGETQETSASMFDAFMVSMALTVVPNIAVLHGEKVSAVFLFLFLGRGRLEHFKYKNK